jgi:alginate O-acetyltransferase complex protein AlgI
MAPTAPLFLVFALVAIVSLRIASSGPSRRAAVFVLNALFLLSLINSPLQLAPLIGFVLLGYGAIAIAAHKRSSSALALLTAGLVATFIWLKRYPIVSAVPTFSFDFTVVGLSYVLFRILHVLVDVSQGSLRRPSFFAYLNYVLFFLSLLSGPIQRYEDFAPQIETRPSSLEWQDVKTAIGRVLVGYLMVIVLGAAAANFIDIAKPRFFDALVHDETVAGIWSFALLSTTYLVSLFLNFAGYMHIVIGIGGLAGIVLPENFNHPFVSKNFLDLWTRWHITLSNWFRFYLFNPVLKSLADRWVTIVPMPYLGVAAFFLTFLVMGAWHGATPIFLIYGLFLGAGVSVNRLWQIWAPKFLGKSRYKALSSRPWYIELSRSATLSYLAVALISFWIDEEHAVLLAKPSGLLIVFSAFIAMTLVGAILCGLWDIAIVRVRAIFVGHAGSMEEHAVLAPRFGRPGLILVPLLVLALASAAASAGALFATGALSGGSLPYAVATVVLCMAILTSTYVAAGALDPAVERFLCTLRVRLRQADAMAIWLGIRAFIVFNLAMLANSAPELIYKAF